MYSLLANDYNYQQIRRSESQVKYLVIHYTGNNGDTARNNLIYYRNNVVKASAHFFVDEKEICCSVPWYFTAWHCGTKGTYKHKDCRNSNSIGIEMCSRRYENGTYYFKPKTIESAAKFVAQQMKNYNIPIENVVRHYDVTGKLCPRPFINDKAWDGFKRKVMEYYNGKVQEKEGEEMSYYEKLEEIPAGEQRELIKELVNAGIIKGNSKGLHLSSDMVRMFVFMKRMGVIKMGLNKPTIPSDTENRLNGYVVTYVVEVNENGEMVLSVTQEELEKQLDSGNFVVLLHPNRRIYFYLTSLDVENKLLYLKVITQTKDDLYYCLAYDEENKKFVQIDY